MDLTGLFCTGWLLIMNSQPSNYTLAPITTTVICVETEKQCRYIGGIQETSLRTDLHIQTEKSYGFECVDMSKK